MMQTGIKRTVGPERSVIELIIALRAAGKSYDMIAVALNNRGLKGPQGGRWFGGTIHRFTFLYLACEGTSGVAITVAAQRSAA